MFNVVVYYVSAFATSVAVYFATVTVLTVLFWIHVPIHYSAIKPLGNRGAKLHGLDGIVNVIRSSVDL